MAMDRTRARKGIVVMWWAFFDWVAVVQWKALLLVSFLGLILGPRRKYSGCLWEHTAGTLAHACPANTATGLSALTSEPVT